MENPTRPSIHHLLESSLYVDDVERSRSFYEELLGFETLHSDARFSVLAVAEGQVLLLFERGAARAPSSTPGGVIPPHDGGGELHLAFAVGRDDLPLWEERLEARGVDIESRVRWKAGGTSIYFRDPDGHLVELATPGLWPNY